MFRLIIKIGLYIFEHTITLKWNREGASFFLKKKGSGALEFKVRVSYLLAGYPRQKEGNISTVKKTKWIYNIRECVL